MKRTLPIFVVSLYFTIAIGQPILDFTPVILTGPSLVQPVDITGCGDGSGRLFIVEKRGSIRIVQNGAVLSTFFLDIQDQVMDSGERGLLGLTFHPSYPDSPYIYVNYVIEGTIINRISRFTVSSNPNVIDEGTELELFTQAGVETNHKAGDLAFGPDGYLYIGMGDGGGGGDPTGAGQNLETLLGKILRIDVNAPSGNLNYSIPPDNPFVGVTGRDEIWAFGIRNPWRISFDRFNGDFWIADVGQNEWEEVDMVPAGTPGGMNFGWDCREGNHPYQPNNCSGNAVFTDPIHEYPHDCVPPCLEGYGASITGGFVYRGDNYPVLQGCYVCADFVSNYLWMVLQTGTSPQTFDVFVQDGSGIISGLVTFGEDDDGELYASNLAGTLYELSASGFLPVQWENIIATVVPNGNNIEWTLHETFGIEYFAVQRSSQSNFENFTTVAQVQPNLDEINYEYKDLFLNTVTVYYRVAAFLSDGSIEYSPIARILQDPLSKPTLVYAQDTKMWRINLPGDWRNGDITLFDLQGKEVYKKQIDSEHHIDLSSPITPGCYYVKVSGEMGSWSDQVVW